MARLTDILTKRNSGCIAKRRLRLVLVSDRGGCTPEILEMIKDDMIKVISKYMEIDADGLEIKVSRVEERKTGARLPVLYASIPVRALLAKGTY